MPGKIFVAFNIVSTSNFFLVARESDAPLAEVYRSAVLTPPHTQRNITISPVRPVMHRVELWTTVDGVNLDQLRGRCDIDASMDTKIAFNAVSFIVDGSRGAPHYDPASGQAQYVNPDIELKLDVDTGLYNFVLFKGGFGAIDIGTHLGLLTDGQGFEWIDGQLFSEGEEYTLMINNLVTVAVDGGSSGVSFPEDVIELTGDTTIDNSHYNALLYLNAPAGITTLSIADIGVIPEATKMGINTHGGSQRNVALQLSVGATCMVNGIARNTIYIGKSEAVTFMKKGTSLFIVAGGEEMSRVGQRVTCDGVPPPNALAEAGGWHLKADYPRFFYWYVNTLPVGELGTGTQDVTPNADNITKFIIGTTKFWMPDTTGRYIKNVKAGRLANSNEDYQVGPHTHPGLTSVQTGAHSSASVALSGPVRVLVNNGGGGVNTGQMICVVEPNAVDVDNEVKNIATNFYRLT